MRVRKVQLLSLSAVIALVYLLLHLYSYGYLDRQVKLIQTAGDNIAAQLGLGEYELPTATNSSTSSTELNSEDYCNFPSQIKIGAEGLYSFIYF